MSFKQLWQEPKNRSKTYNILNNIFSAITHGIGFCIAVAGLVILIVKHFLAFYNFHVLFLGVSMN